MWIFFQSYGPESASSCLNTYLCFILCSCLVGTYLIRQQLYPLHCYQRLLDCKFVIISVPYV